MSTHRLFDWMPWADWLALASLFGLWVGYALLASRVGARKRSLLATTNQYRARWMLQATHRDPRMLDGIINQSLSTTPAFFSSTSILIIGGLLAVMGTTDKAVELVNDLPFAQTTSLPLFEFKLVVLVGIFVYAFFRFSWCMRQYTFVALIIGSMPPPGDFEAGLADRDAFTQKAARVVGLAAETFNDGLRAYYFSFAALAWFFSPMAMVVATGFVVLVLYSREFHSEVLGILRD
ncbi:MAG: DUF599 domain-containing protein [Burkholderiaceae bacterium]|nr:DUF599 domain-containing protein [Burkholderiaceae bacterium]